MHGAEGGDGGVHQGLDLLGIGHVALNGQGLGAQSFALGHGLGGGFGVAGIAQYHVGAAPGQLQAHGLADAPASAGDHGGLSCKVHIISP